MEKDTPAGFKSVKDFEKYSQSAYDELKDELDRYGRIVQAIASSNAVTMVRINGQELAVARAL